MSKVLRTRRRPTMMGDMMKLSTHEGECYIRIDHITFIRDHFVTRKDTQEPIGTCLVGTSQGQREVCWHSAYQVAEVYDDYMAGRTDIIDHDVHAPDEDVDVDALFAEAIDP